MTDHRPMCGPVDRGRLGAMIQTVITSVAILGTIIVGLLAVVPSLLDLHADR